jgi:hypothetical protein
LNADVVGYGLSISGLANQAQAPCHAKCRDQVSINGFMSFRARRRIMKCKRVGIVIEPVYATRLKVEAIAWLPMEFEPETVS